MDNNLLKTLGLNYDYELIKVKKTESGAALRIWREKGFELCAVGGGMFGKVRLIFRKERTAFNRAFA